MKKMCISIITIAIDVRFRYGPNFVSAFFDTFILIIFICNSFFTVLRKIQQARVFGALFRVRSQICTISIDSKYWVIFSDVF